MNDDEAEVTDEEITQEIRREALHLAIQASAEVTCPTTSDGEGIVQMAKVFEAYLAGADTEETE